MIGENIRSVRHLFRVSDTSLRTVLIRVKENAWDFGKVIKMPSNSQFGETMFIFNNTFRQSNWGIDSVLMSNDFKKLAKNENIGHFSRLVSVSKNECYHFEGVFKEIILLPPTFDKDYEKFLKENSKMVNGLILKFGIDMRDIRIKRFYCYSNGSKNFFSWAITAYYHGNADMNTIRNILIWNESYQQLAKNLSKGTITAYTSSDALAVLMDEMTELRKEKRINDSINSFNTAQKKMFKENELSDDVKQALWRLSRLSDAKRINFIKKVSSIDNFEELTRQLKFATSVHFKWTKESFMDFITNVEDMKYEKIFENDNIVLVKTLDYETIKHLGKTTNWCISKNKSYWNNYIENHHGNSTQYMIFDFSKLEDDNLSIVGFTTTRNKGITSAHNFINENLMGNEEGEQVFLESFISRFKDNKNIFSILSDDGIDITLVVQYDAPLYEWDKENLMKYLYECVHKENVDIIMDKGDKMVLSVSDDGIRYFFGDAYNDNIPSEYYYYQHVIFIDFSKNKYDNNKIQFGIIEEGSGDEDYCINMYNERSQNNGCNFDSKLIEFGLPYNTIKRTNNINIRLRNAIYSFNMPMINECLKEFDKKNLDALIREVIGTDTFYELVMRSIRNYMSFDYLKLIYDNGHHLNEILPYEYIGEMIKQLTYDMRCTSRATNKYLKMEGVSEDDIKNFFDYNIPRREDAKYIGLYVAIKSIIDHENEVSKPSQMSDIGKNITNFILGDAKKCELYTDIIKLLSDKVCYTSQNSCVTRMAEYAYSKDVKELIAIIEEKAKGNDWLEKYCEKCRKSYTKNNSKKAQVFISPSSTNVTVQWINAQLGGEYDIATAPTVEVGGQF